MLWKQAVTGWRRWLNRLFLRGSPASSLGGRGEDFAAGFLTKLGYSILERQHRTPYGEIDLIATDGDTIVFVEVKTRTSMTAGEPSEAVTPDKQRKLTRSALAFLKRRRWLQRRCRFDVVAILWTQDNQPDVRHYQNAFEATDVGQMY